MNPKLKPFAMQIIELHKQSPGYRFDWTTIKDRDWNKLKWEEIVSIKRHLTDDLGVLTNDASNSPEYTRLVKDDFTFEAYTENLKIAANRAKIEADLLETSLKNEKAESWPKKHWLLMMFISAVIGAAIMFAATQIAKLF